MKNLNNKETTSVLAGLRILQDMIEDGTLENYPRKLPHFDDIEPLTTEQIDSLCEDISLNKLSITE